MILHENDLAPDFVLPDQDGHPVSLARYLGKWVLIYFYPKDDTPGCTVEACGFRDNLTALKGLSLDVLGISPDNAASHKKFATKFSLNFLLLADEDKEVLQKYGAWGLKKFMGRENMGVLRMSFLINPKGKVAKIYPKVRPEDHPAEICADVQRLSAI